MTNRCHAADDTTESIHRKEHDVAALVVVAVVALAATLVVLRMREMKIPSCVVLNMNKPNILFILICFK
jgi:hypothetical protein